MVQPAMKRALAVTLALALVIPMSMASSPQEVPVPGPDHRRLGPTDPEELVSFSIVLEQPGRDALLRWLSQGAEHGWTRAREPISPEAFGERFGLPEREIDRVVGWLHEHGIAVTDRPAQRTSLAVEGTISTVRDLFGVAIADWLTPDGQRYHAPDGVPAIPPELQGLVAAVDGLDSEPARAFATPYAVRGGVLWPADVAVAYEIDALHAAGLHGEGQTVGIVSFDTFLDGDVEAFDAATGIDALGEAAPPVIRRSLPGAPTTPGEGSQEVALDIQVIRAVAPGAQIINYEAPNNQGFAPVMREILRRGETDIVSISWGLCELHTGAEARLAEDREFEAAFAAGITVFVASGDHGAHGCRFGGRDRNDFSVSVDYPSANPYLLSVGGTYLSVRTDGTYLEEAAWEDALSGSGTGGGVSAYQARPSWQEGVGVDNASSTGNRQVPDVAGPADPDSGFLMFWTRPGGAQRATAGGGTSASAPFWAGVIVLTRQLAEAEGVGRDGMGRLGSVPPLLYEAYQRDPSVFHDVTLGGNLLHDATVGWDYATGLGTPRAAPLAQLIVEMLAE